MGKQDMWKSKAKKEKGRPLVTLPGNQSCANEVRLFYTKHYGDASRIRPINLLSAEV
jgi:hypothetical protein